MKEIEKFWRGLPPPDPNVPSKPKRFRWYHLAIVLVVGIAGIALLLYLISKQ